MEHKFDVIVCGSLHLDIVVKSPHLPQLDETVPGSSWNKICGGKGGNQAVMAARAGAKCAMIGRIGDDEFGATLVQNLQANQVDTQCISTDASAGSGMSVAITDRNGDYGAVIVSGANLGLTPDICASDWLKLGGATILILQNEIPEAANIAAAAAAKKSGGKVILNAAPARAMSQALLDLVDVLVVNKVEAEMLSGVSVTDPESAISALPKLASKQRNIVITLGGQGLVCAPANAEPQIIAPIKIKVASTHGAGDCFVGSLARALAQGSSLVDACTIANLKAARFVAGENAE
jgi:ribokinase